MYHFNSSVDFNTAFFGLTCFVDPLGITMHTFIHNSLLWNNINVIPIKHKNLSPLYFLLLSLLICCYHHIYYIQICNKPKAYSILIIGLCEHIF